MSSPAPSPQPEPADAVPDWLDPINAALRLGVNVRQLQKRAAAGQIAKRVLPRKPHERAAPVVYSRADLDAIAAGRPNTHAVVVAKKPQAPQNGPQKAPIVSESTDLVPEVREVRDFWRRVIAEMAGLHDAKPEPKPWMTLDEASRWSGLPAAWLRRKAEDGSIHALDIGKHQKGGRWRFNRASLSELG